MHSSHESTSGGDGPAALGSWGKLGPKEDWTGSEGGEHDDGNPLIDDSYLGCETDRLQGIKGAGQG